MTIALIAHTQRDSAAAIGICAIMPEARSVAWDGVSAANRTPMILLWSQSAAEEQLGERFAALALAHLAPVVLCRLDETELPVDLAALNIETFDGALSGRAFHRAAHAALIEARRHAPLRRKEPAAAPREDHAFAIGLARGFTSSVAVLGLGGVAAVGAADKVGAALAGDINPLTMFSTSSASAATLEEYGPHHVVEPGHLLTDAEMRRAIAELQTEAAADRLAVDARLAHAQSEIVQQSAVTEGAVHALESLSQQHGALSPIRARPISAAPIAPATHAALMDAPHDVTDESKAASADDSAKAAG